MSRYEWEEGVITIPTAEWPTFRTAILKAYNDRLEKDLKDATAALVKIQAAGKGKRAEGRLKAQREALAAFCGVTVETRFCHKGFDVVGHEDLRERALRIEKILFVQPEGSKNYFDERTVLRTPKRKDFDFRPLTKDANIDCDGDATITLSNAKHSVGWQVSDNNHACERARRDPMANVLFLLLSKVKWTRGSGGQIVGNDEYNRDNRYEGGGSNYVTSEYGPEPSKKDTRRRLAFYR